MKTLYTTLYVLVLVGFLALFLSACGERPTTTKLDAVVTSVTADGAVSVDEVKQLVAAFKEDKEASGASTWKLIGAAAGSALTAMFPILRLIPNRWILGTQPDPEVALVAGMLSER